MYQPFSRVESQPKTSSTYTIKSITSKEWQDKIVKVSDDKILQLVKDATEWKQLRHSCTNYDKLISSHKFNSLHGIKRVIAYWTLHYFCTLIALQEQVDYFRNRFESYQELVNKYRKELTNLNKQLDSESDLRYKVQELEKENVGMKKEITSLRKSVAQYKVWNTRYRNQLNAKA